MARVAADRGAPSRDRHKHNGDKPLHLKPAKSEDGSFVETEQQMEKAAPNTRTAFPVGLQGPVLGAVLSGGLLVIVSALGSAETHVHELFHIYFQPPLIMVAMLWLWGCNVAFFEQRHIRYKVCFSEADQPYCLDSTQIFQVAGTVSVLVIGGAATFAYHTAHGQFQAASMQPPLVYTLLLLVMLLPMHLLYKDTRLFFSQTVFRVVTPWREVTWADFLLADVLTSLAKPLADTGRAVCHMTTGPVMSPHSTDKMCGRLSWVIPLGFALPYAWRFCQCIRVYLDTGAQPQIFNAIKYSTAFPAIFLVAAKDWVAREDWLGFWRPLWIGAQLLNTTYSYFWDIERDWEIQFFTASMGGPRVCNGLFPRPGLKGELLFGRPFYHYLMVSNLALRLAWLYKLSTPLRHSHAAIMLFALLEAFRRAQWVPVRIEVELRKLQHLRPELGTLVPPVGTSDREPYDSLPLLDKHRLPP